MTNVPNTRSTRTTRTYTGGLKPRAAECVGPRMTIKVDDTYATVTQVYAEDPDMVVIVHTAGRTVATFGQKIAVVVNEHGHAVRAPKPTAEQALTRGARVPSPREWQIIAGAAYRHIVEVPKLPLLTWIVTDVAGVYAVPLVGQVRDDDATPVVAAYADFLETEVVPIHGGDRVEAVGIYLGCPVRVWGETAQLAAKQRAAKAGAA